MSLFIVDTNFLTQAHRDRYPIDVVPTFWNKILYLANEQIICSIDKVRDEIFRNDDELKEWCETNLPSYFWKDSSIALENYSLLVSWAVLQTSRYSQAAINEFLESDEADAFLIAYTMIDKTNTVLVTYEKPDNSKRKIKIPNVCTEFDVTISDTISLFRSLGITF